MKKVTNFTLWMIIPVLVLSTLAIFLVKKPNLSPAEQKKYDAEYEVRREEQGLIHGWYRERRILGELIKMNEKLEALLRIQHHLDERLKKEDT